MPRAAQYARPAAYVIAPGETTNETMVTLHVSISYPPLSPLGRKSSPELIGYDPWARVSWLGAAPVEDHCSTHKGSDRGVGDRHGGCC